MQVRHILVRRVGRHHLLSLNLIRFSRLNSDLTELGSAIADSGWRTLGSSSTTYRKIGKTIYVQLLMPSTLTTSWVNFGTLSYAPRNDLYFSPYAGHMDGGIYWVQVRILNTGVLSMRGNISSNFRTMISFLIE